MRFVLGALLTLSLSVAACAGPFHGAQAYEGHGFVVRVPTGWHVSTPALQGWTGVSIRSDDGATAAVLFGDNGSSPQSIAGQVLPTEMHVVSSKAQPHGLVEDFASDRRRGRMLLYSLEGHCTVWAMSAPKAVFAADSAQLVEVLSSFHFVSSEPSIEMHTAQPEGAFEIGFPQGWNVDARTIRNPTGVGVYSQVLAKSADETAAYTAYSPFPLTFTIPNAIGMRFGRLPHTTYRDSGVEYRVEQYMDPVAFLHFLSRQDDRFRGMTVGSVKSLPAQSSGVSVDKAAYIEIAFPERHVQGGAFIRTYGWGGNAGQGLWLANVTIWTAKAGHEEEGLDAFLESFRTVRLNPQWAAAQRNATAQQTNIMASVYNDLKTITQANVNRQVDAETDNVRRGVNVATGEDTYTDTEGNLHHIQIDGTSNYYWKRPTGDIVGTSTAQAPGPDVTQLLHVP